MVSTQRPLQQIDTIDKLYASLSSNRQYSAYSGADPALAVRFNTMCLETIRRIAGERSTYFGQAIKMVDRWLGPQSGELIDPLYGIVCAIRSDLENGYLAELSSIAHAEIFSDFVEMADHLLAAGTRTPRPCSLGAS